MITAVLAVTLAGCSAGNKEAAPVKAEEKESSAPGGAAAGSSEEEKTAEYHKITPEEAKKMIDAGGVTIVDVRREDEYRENHIPGAILVPNEGIGDEMPEELPDKDAVLLVHCRSGVRSKEASNKLVALGYTNVYDFGGIIDWPYETEKGEQEK